MKVVQFTDGSVTRELLQCIADAGGPELALRIELSNDEYRSLCEESISDRESFDEVYPDIEEFFSNWPITEVLGVPVFVDGTNVAQAQQEAFAANQRKVFEKLRERAEKAELEAAAEGEGTPPAGIPSPLDAG